MNKQFVLTGSVSREIPMDYRAGASSVVCTPSSATYSVWYSCTPDSVEAKIWNAISSMTAATDQQSVELGSITRLKFTVSSGTSLTVEISQSEG